jgi:hypothetical protein
MSRGIFIRDSRWSEIREQFSEEEKVELRAAVTGEVICPRGFYIDPLKLTGYVAAKIAEANR